MSYSLDFRTRVLQFINETGNKFAASKIFDISYPTIYRWLKKQSKHGSPCDQKPRRLWKKLNPESLESYVKAYPDLTLVDYAKHFGTSDRGIGLALKRLKITRKKRAHCIKKGVKQSVRYFWSS